MLGVVEDQDAALSGEMETDPIGGVRSIRIRQPEGAGARAHRAIDIADGGEIGEGDGDDVGEGLLHDAGDRGLAAAPGSDEGDKAMGGRSLVLQGHEHLADLPLAAEDPALPASQGRGLVPGGRSQGTPGGPPAERFDCLDGLVGRVLAPLIHEQLLEDLVLPYRLGVHPGDSERADQGDVDVLPHGANAEGGSADIDGEACRIVRRENLHESDYGAAVGFFEGQLMGDRPGGVDALKERPPNEPDGIAKMLFAGWHERHQAMKSIVIGADSTGVEPDRVAVSGEEVFAALDPELFAQRGDGGSEALAGLLRLVLWPDDGGHLVPGKDARDRDR
jgi:hypothetical protein